MRDENHIDGTDDDVDPAGNLIHDRNLEYKYDAWHRLVKVRSREDSDIVLQTSEYDALGRRISKQIDNSGDLDRDLVYYYDGQKLIFDARQR